MTGIIFLLSFWAISCIFFCILNYIPCVGLKKFFIHFSKIKNATVTSFKRKRFSIIPLFQGTIEFTNDEKTKYTLPIAQRISAKAQWIPWFFKKENAQNFLFGTDSIPCHLDFYIFKTPYSSGRRVYAFPVKTYENFWRRNLLFLNIISTFLVTSSFALPIVFGTDNLVGYDRFTRMESLDLGGRVFKENFLDLYHNDFDEKLVDDNISRKVILSFTDEICSKTPERPVCQKREKIQELLESTPVNK